MTTLCFFCLVDSLPFASRAISKSFFFKTWNLELIIPKIVKYMEKNLHKMKPRYCEHILPVPWPFVISRFHYTFCYKIQIQTTIPIVSRWPVQNNYQCMEKANLQRNSSLSSRSFLCCHRLPGYQARNYSFSHRSLLWFWVPGDITISSSYP